MKIFTALLMVSGEFLDHFNLFMSFGKSLNFDF
jgi:hypothetical protein